MKKTSFLFFISLSWLSAFGLVSANSGQLYYADHLVDLRNFATEGQVLHQSMPNRATMTLADNGYASIRPRSYDPVTAQLLPQPENEFFTFDISLSHFQADNRFSVIYPQYSEEYFYSTECRLSSRQVGNNPLLFCEYWRHFDGQKTRVTFSTSADLIGNATYGGDDSVLTLTITRSGSDYIDFRLWEKGNTSNGVVNFYTRVSDRTPLAYPKIVLDQAQVSSPDATISLHRFYSSDNQYYHEWPVRLVSQVDPNWRDELLGHSATQTIGGIGCLLASATMLFRTHGYYQFPDGTELDPSSLNRWLQAQKDGYVNKNLLVWTALTRLSNQLHDYYLSRGIRLPKFEYRAITRMSRLIYPHHIQDSIYQEQPIIVEIPGHFVVADGINGWEEINIKDPLNLDNQSSELTDLWGEPVSLRQLVPSFTDQSYFLVNVIGDAKANFYDGQGNYLNHQSLTLYEPETTNIIGQQYIIAKPNSGQYKLRFISQTPGARFSFFVYNEQGEVATYQDVTGEIDLPQTLEFDFTYQKDQATDFFLLGSEPPAPKDPWQVLFEETVWSWQFPQLMIKHLYQEQKYDQLILIAGNYLQRGYLDQSIYDQLLQLISDS